MRELRLLAAERVGVEHEHLDERRLLRLRAVPATVPIPSLIGKVSGDLDQVVAVAVEIAEFGRRQLVSHFAPGQHLVDGLIPRNRPQSRVVAVFHVMVAKRCVNPHSKGRDASVDIEELGADGPGVSVFIHVVSQQKDVRNGHGLGLAPDLRRDSPGAVIAGAGVPDEDETRCSRRILLPRAERRARTAGRNPGTGPTRANQHGKRQNGPRESRTPLAAPPLCRDRAYHDELYTIHYIL